MIIHHNIAALRGDDTPQRKAQDALRAAMSRWKNRPEIAAVLRAIDDFSDGADLQDCPNLARLFQSAKSGQAFAQSFIEDHAKMLIAMPMGHVALRHAIDKAKSTLQLALRGNVSLSLVALDGDIFARLPAQRSISFAPLDSWELILAGKAEAEQVFGHPIQETGGKHMRLEKRPMAMLSGDIFHRNAAMEGRLYKTISGSFVRLCLSRSQSGFAPVREYDLASGQLVHQAAAHAVDSRHQIMATLLGKMGRSDAAPLLSDMALRSGELSLRWQALRETLGLDTARGFAAVSAIAQNSHDPLAASAGALRAQLIETYPQLKVLNLCPA